jgi:PPOX class probable FMN-dependent enzyme
MDQIDLRQLYGKPSELVREAHVPFLDDTAQRFIRACCFLIISSHNDEGFIDISPRGGEAGFVRITDKRTIEFLDMPGNKKILTLTNVIKNNRVGLMFVVSGNRELIRAYGTAELISDKQEIAKWGGDVASNKVLVRVHLEKVFPHCGKAIGKADLWNHESWQNEASENVPGLLDMAKGMASARREDCDRH